MYLIRLSAIKLVLRSNFGKMVDLEREEKGSTPALNFVTYRVTQLNKMIMMTLPGLSHRIDMQITYKFYIDFIILITFPQFKEDCIIIMLAHHL